jgi:hypothetical protein
MKTITFTGKKMETPLPMEAMAQFAKEFLAPEYTDVGEGDNVALIFEDGRNDMMAQVVVVEDGAEVYRNRIWAYEVERLQYEARLVNAKEGITQVVLRDRESVWIEEFPDSDAGWGELLHKAEFCWRDNMVAIVSTRWECPYFPIALGGIRRFANLFENGVLAERDSWGDKPTKIMALVAGLEDNSYLANQHVASYAGVVTVSMKDGRTYKATGHRPQGTPYAIYKNGWIEFVLQPVPEI